MAALRSPEEVFSRFIDQYGYDDDGDPHALCLFAYALVERDRFDWVQHIKEQNGGSAPTQDDITSWYASKPESYFRDKSQTAISWYWSFARALLADDIEAAKKQAVQEYIGKKLQFLPQLWISLCCNAVFVLLIGAMAMYVFADFSPIAWVREHSTNIK